MAGPWEQEPQSGLWLDRAEWEKAGSLPEWQEMAEVWGWGKERLLGNDAPGKAHRWAFPTLTFCQGHEEWVTQSRCFIHTGWRAGKMNEKGWCPLYSYTSPVTTPLLPIRVPQISALCLHLKTALEVNKKPRFTRFINSTYILEGSHFQR